MVTFNNRWKNAPHRDSKGFTRKQNSSGGKATQAKRAKKRLEQPIGPRQPIPRGRLLDTFTTYNHASDIFERFDIYESLKSIDRITVVVNKRIMIPDTSWTAFFDQQRRNHSHMPCIQDY